MITRIEIDGFKTFRDFKLELAPLQVIVGPNGAGKSNLFDALVMLSRLADHDLRSALIALRGHGSELFLLRPDGSRETHFRLAVEMMVEPKVKDEFGAETDLQFTRLRYELAIVQQQDEIGLDRLYIDQETLTAIPKAQDAWIKQHNLKEGSYWLPVARDRAVPFISTKHQDGVTVIQVHQDGRSGRRIPVRSSKTQGMERTALSAIATAAFPHALAARQEMLSWHLLQLNVETLRQPSVVLGPQVLGSDGSNLAGVLARLYREDPFSSSDIGRDIANLVSDIIGVEVETDASRGQHRLSVVKQNGLRISSSVLSDGTLRMLALIALKNDVHTGGVVLLEEPENGVHPARLEQIATLLRGLSTDVQDPEQYGLPLRQLLCNTHSPLFISRPSILPHVAFAFRVSRIDPARPGEIERVTRIEPLSNSSWQADMPSGSAGEESRYLIEEIKQYLDSAGLESARRSLRHNGSMSMATVLP